MFFKSQAAIILALLSAPAAAAERDVFGRPFSKETMIPAGTNVCLTRDALDVRPVLLEAVKPLYPAGNLLSGHKGSVVIRFRVGEDGKATFVSKETKGDINAREWFGNHAAIAVASWTFKPGQRAGAPVAVNCEIEFGFSFD